jgi:hypothetical protein
MKKVIILAVLFCTIFTACSDKKSNKEIVEYITVDKGAKISETITVKDTTYPIPVGEENFAKLVTFIEKKGFSVPQAGIASDYQYTFFDKKGTRHALITIRRDKDGNPSLQGTVDQISVWAYYGGKKDLNHYFGYSITKERAFPFIVDDSNVKKHIDAVREGYGEFLALVNKK